MARTHVESGVSQNPSADIREIRYNHAKVVFGRFARTFAYSVIAGVLFLTPLSFLTPALIAANPALAYVAFGLLCGTGLAGFGALMGAMGMLELGPIVLSKGEFTYADGDIGLKGETVTQ